MASSTVRDQGRVPKMLRGPGSGPSGILGQAEGDLEDEGDCGMSP